MSKKGWFGSQRPEFKSYFCQLTAPWPWESHLHWSCLLTYTTQTIVSIPRHPKDQVPSCSPMMVQTAWWHLLAIHKARGHWFFPSSKPTLANGGWEMSAFCSMLHLRQEKTHKNAPKMEGRKESVEPMATWGHPCGRGSLCQSGLLIAGLKLTLASLGKASEGEQELTVAFSTEGAHRSAATTATDRSNHPSSLRCWNVWLRTSTLSFWPSIFGAFLWVFSSLKIQSSGRSVQLAMLGGVPVSTQGGCLPPTKTTHRRDVPEMEKTAKAQTNVHSGLNATFGSRGNMGHIELLHSLGLFTTSPPPVSTEEDKLARARTFGKAAMPKRNSINPGVMVIAGRDMRSVVSHVPPFSDSTSNSVTCLYLSRLAQKFLSGTKPCGTQKHSH